MQYRFSFDQWYTHVWQTSNLRGRKGKILSCWHHCHMVMQWWILSNRVRKWNCNMSGPIHLEDNRETKMWYDINILSLFLWICSIVGYSYASCSGRSRIPQTCVGEGGIYHLNLPMIGMYIQNSRYPLKKGSMNMFYHCCWVLSSWPDLQHLPP